MKRPSKKEVTAILLLMAAMAAYFLIEWHADRRFAIYNIQRELRAGMPQLEVDNVINRHMFPYLVRHDLENRVAITASLGGIELCTLEIQFTSGLFDLPRFMGATG